MRLSLRTVFAVEKDIVSYVVREDPAPLFDRKGELLRVAAAASLQLDDMAGIENHADEASRRATGERPHRAGDESPPSGLELPAHAVLAVGGNVPVYVSLMIVIVGKRVIDCARVRWSNSAASSSGVMS